MKPQAIEYSFNPIKTGGGGGGGGGGRNPPPPPVVRSPKKPSLNRVKDQIKLLHDKYLEKNPFKNQNASESDIEEANASFNLSDEDEEERTISHFKMKNPEFLYKRLPVFNASPNKPTLKS